MKTPERHYRPTIQIFVCTNLRPSASPLPCCSNADGDAVATALRNAASRSSFRGQIWVTQTGCLTFCNRIGTTVVAYPMARWFTEVKVEDIPTLLREVEAAYKAPGPFPV